MAGGMDFFGHQERARRATGRLVVLFALALLGITLCIHFAASAVVTVASEGHANWWRGDVMLVTVLATIVVVGGGALFKTAQLRRGGPAVATLLGGTPVPIDTDDEKARMLRNVVEEMAIASGVPVPDVYVLAAEDGMNAFAAGWGTADAVVAVTRGCLDRLDRDELQGVVAHEFSHVFHGDMRLNIRLMGVLFGIVCITTIGRILVEAVGRGGRSSGNKGKGGAVGLLLFGVALVVIGSIGVLFARLIQAAVSRQREFLADASAVQYTRNPRGIGMALAKIGGLGDGGARLHTAHAEAASHMLFADGMRRFFGGAMASHPPIAQRVERVLPGFLRQLQSNGSMVAAAAATPLPAGAAGIAGDGPGARIASAALLASVGAPMPEHLDAARDLLRALPLDLAVATREPPRARAIVAALLLDADPSRRDAQLTMLRSRDAANAHEVAQQYGTIAGLAAATRLPLLELAMPSLRALPPAEREALRAEARALALHDGRLAPFEFALLRLVDRHVRLPEEQLRRSGGRPTALAQHPGEVAVVVSAIARVGAADDAAAAAAFARARDLLGVPTPLELLPTAACRMEELEGAVDALARVSPFGKRNLLAACAAAASADGTLSPEEADLLRALAALWDCPIPMPVDSRPRA